MKKKINLRLAHQRGLSQETIAEIENQNEYEDVVLGRLEEANTIEEIDYYKQEWHKIQFTKQRLWGFPEDIKYHRWWYLPGCTCPKMDNDDAYPTGYYVMSKACPIHGNLVDDS